MATPIIEAPVVGAKVLRISDRGYLRSPAVRTDDWPFSPRGYFSPRGFFFWAFPPVILDVAYPLAPGYALAIVQVLPHDAPGLCTITPAVPAKWPDYAPTVPPGADCVVARNLVGIARAIRFDCIVVREDDYAVSAQHLREYGVPVHKPSRASLSLGVDTDAWFLDLARVPLACGDYHACGRPVREYADLLQWDESALAHVPYIWYAWAHCPRAARALLDQAVAQVRTILSR